MALSVEVAKVAEHFQWLTEEESKNLPPEKLAQVREEIGEVMIYLTELADKLCIDPAEAERWQHDLWYRIVEAALGDTPEQVKLEDLPGWQRPAVSRYAATTPNLLRWFKGYNRGKPYRAQVGPLNFLLAYQSGPIVVGKAAPKPVSAYDEVPEEAAAACFDRETGEPVSPHYLKTYEEALTRYHLHSEAKFHNGDYLDCGVTQRRHIIATAVFSLTSSTTLLITMNR